MVVPILTSQCIWAVRKRPFAALDADDGELSDANHEAVESATAIEDYCTPSSVYKRTRLSFHLGADGTGGANPAYGTIPDPLPNQTWTLPSDRETLVPDSTTWTDFSTEAASVNAAAHLQHGDKYAFHVASFAPYSQTRLLDPSAFHCSSNFSPGSHTELASLSSGLMSPTRVFETSRGLSGMLPAAAHEGSGPASAMTTDLNIPAHSTVTLDLTVDFDYTCNHDMLTLKPNENLEARDESADTMLSGKPPSLHESLQTGCEMGSHWELGHLNYGLKAENSSEVSTYDNTKAESYPHSTAHPFELELISGGLPIRPMDLSLTRDRCCPIDATSYSGCLEYEPWTLVTPAHITPSTNQGRPYVTLQRFVAERTLSTDRETPEPIYYYPEEEFQDYSPNADIEVHPDPSKVVLREEKSVVGEIIAETDRLTETDAILVNKPKPRRKAFDDKTREATSKTRDMGACIRCKMQRARVSTIFTMQSSCPVRGDWC